jgi:hypothetical protein
MKKTSIYLSVLVFSLFTSVSIAQVGIGTNTPAPSAQLDVTSTEKGFLPPRMTTAQRNLIASPATGLLVFQTDNIAGYYFYDGTAWVGLGTAGSSSSNSSTGILALSYMDMLQYSAPLFTTVFCFTNNKLYTKLPDMSNFGQLKRATSNNLNSTTVPAEYVISFTVTDTIRISWTGSGSGNYSSGWPQARLYYDDSNINNGLGVLIPSSIMPIPLSQNYLLKPGFTYRLYVETYSGSTMPESNVSTWSCSNPNVTNIQYHKKTNGASTFTNSTTMLDGSNNNYMKFYFDSGISGSTWYKTE